MHTAHTACTRHVHVHHVRVHVHVHVHVHMHHVHVACASCAPQAVYEFWYKDLCDVYLEAIKPVMQLDSSVPGSDNAKRKHATQTVLHCRIHSPCPHPRPRPNPNPSPSPGPDPGPNPHQVLHCCIHNGLRLLHPFMPFVTEELYQRLQLLCHQPRTTVMLATYPEPKACAMWSSPKAEADMTTITRLSASIRSLRGLYLKASQPLSHSATQPLS